MTWEDFVNRASAAWPDVGWTEVLPACSVWLRLAGASCMMGGGITLPVTGISMLRCWPSLLTSVRLPLKGPSTLPVSDTVTSCTPKIGSVKAVAESASCGSEAVMEVTVSGRLETLAALNAALRAIPSGEKVKVVGVVDTNTVLVEPLA